MFGHNNAGTQISFYVPWVTDRGQQTVAECLRSEPASETETETLQFIVY